MQSRERDILTCIVAVVLINIKPGASGTNILSNLKKTSKIMTKICHIICISLTLSSKTASVLRRATFTRENANTINNSKSSFSLRMLNYKPSNLISLTGRTMTIAPCNLQLRYVVAALRFLIMRLKSL